MTMKSMLVVASLSALPLASAYAGAEAAVSGEPSADQEMRYACQAAIPQYLATLKANPNDAVSHNLLGTCRQRLGKQKAAIREYESAIKLNPNYAQAYNNLATVYHAQRKYNKAVAQYEKAIALDPGMATAHRNLGTALLARGKTEEGFAAYAEAQRLDPTILVAVDAVSVDTTNAALAQQYFYFAKIAARSGQLDASIEFLRKAQAAGFQGFGKVRSDPDFKSVVPDRRFAAIAR
jgi:tetratricopeptide (TPR) repeat protein